jgi:hypothetical protein
MYVRVGALAAVATGRGADATGVGGDAGWATIGEGDGDGDGDGDADGDGEDGDTAGALAPDPEDGEDGEDSEDGEDGGGDAGGPIFSSTTCSSFERSLGLSKPRSVSGKNMPTARPSSTGTLPGSTRADLRRSSGVTGVERYARISSPRGC